MKYAIIPVTAFEQNCTVLWCEETSRAAVVDAGGNVERIVGFLEQHGLTLEKLILTHGHIDHAGGAATLAERYGVPIEGPHRDDQFWLDGIEQQGKMFGLAGARSCAPDRWLEHGDKVHFGKVELEVLHAPGHTPGHVVFFHRPSQLAQVGDVLFAGSIGRTDFPKGDYDTLIASIRERLFALGDDVQFIPGHGPMSSFGHERRTNPFCGD